MTYLEASKILYIKKTDIEYEIKLTKARGMIDPTKTFKFLQALEVAIKVLKDKKEI